MKLIFLLFILSIIPAHGNAANDDFSEAANLTGMQSTTAFDLEGTTIEDDESFSFGSAWFRWTPPGPGILSLSITPQNEGVTFFTNAYVGGSLQTLTPLGFGNSIFNFNGFVETVDPGEVVMVQIGKNSTTPNGDVGSLGIHFEPGPGNDSRLSPVFLGSLSGITIEPDNSQATRHRLDWLGTQNLDSGTLWYRWQAPEDGLLYLHAQPSDLGYNSVVSIHRGNGGSTDEPIRTFEAGTTTKSIRISVLKEASYLISYSTDKRQTPGKSALSFQFLTPDPASEFSEAIDLSSQLPTNVSGSFRSATLDTSVSYEATLDDPNSFPPAQSLWYSWEAPKDGFYRLTRTQGSTQLVLWKNNEESPPTFLEKNFNNQGVNFFATTGERFLVSALEAANLAYRPDSHFRWQLTSLDIAESDDFESRIDMGAAETWETESTNTGATAEPGEPHHAGNTPNQSIWYSWTAPNNGNYLLNTTGANFAPSLAVYAGSNLESLTPVAQGTYRVVFEASAATTYRHRPR